MLAPVFSELGCLAHPNAKWTPDEIYYELRHYDESMASLYTASYIPRGDQIPPAAGGAAKSGDNKLVVG